jgi:hypothetical protein
MRAHKLRITIPENHEITLKLPSDLPPGEAEVIVLSDPEPSKDKRGSFEQWLDAWIRALPPSPPIALRALRRENLYE